MTHHITRDLGGDSHSGDRRKVYVGRGNNNLWGEIIKGGYSRGNNHLWGCWRQHLGTRIDSENL